MVKKLSRKILTLLIRNNAVTEGNKAIVLFGIEQGLRSGIEIVLMLLTGVLMNLFWQSVIILISFIPVRVYAGGYHAKTPMQCVIKSWVLFTAALVWIKYIPDNTALQIAVLFVTGVWLSCYCPVQNAHKPLRENEKSRYKFKALKYFFIDVCVFCLGYLARRQIISQCIASGMLMLLVMLIAGTLKNVKSE